MVRWTHRDAQDEQEELQRNEQKNARHVRARVTVRTDGFVDFDELKESLKDWDTREGRPESLRLTVEYGPEMALHPTRFSCPGIQPASLVRLFCMLEAAQLNKLVVEQGPYRRLRNQWHRCGIDVLMIIVSLLMLCERQSITSLTLQGFLPCWLLSYADVCKLDEVNTSLRSLQLHFCEACTREEGECWVAFMRRCICLESFFQSGRYDDAFASVPDKWHRLRVHPPSS